MRNGVIGHLKKWFKKLPNFMLYSKVLPFHVLEVDFLTTFI
jgi:hypothetical protein